jgi:hypothetical protein
MYVNKRGRVRFYASFAAESFPLDRKTIRISAGECSYRRHHIIGVRAIRNTRNDIITSSSERGK